jgi:hypothetical protein
VVAKVRERLAVRKQVAQTFDGNCSRKKLISSLLFMIHKVIFHK